MEIDSPSSLSDEPGSSEKGDQADEILQKRNKLEDYTPYKTDLQRNRQTFLHNLKANAFKSVLAQDESLDRWINAFDQYISAFGYAFTKDDHVLFVKICLRTLDSMDHDVGMLVKLIKLTNRLLKKTHLLSRGDLVLDWRLFHRLFEKTFHSPHHEVKTLSLGMELPTELTKLVAYARVYFAAESTGEMLAEWRQYLCPYSNKFNRYVHCFSIFLPTLLYPEEAQFGYKLWLEELMNLWIALPNGGSSKKNDNYFLYLFSVLAQDAKGFIDWDPYLSVIFERFMKLLHADAYKLSSTCAEIKLYMRWIVYIISDNSKCLDHLRQLFRLRSVNYFISKEKTDPLFREVITSGLDSFSKRLRDERFKKNWYHFAPKTHILNQPLIDEFAGIMVEAVEKINLDDFDLENLYKLCMISSPILSEQAISKLDLAYEQICEPKRLKSALQVFSLSLFPIVTNSEISPQYRSYILPILTNLAATINTYDHNLCYLQMFTMRSIVVLGVPLRDCSSLVESAENLDEFSTQLLLDSQQLEDFSFEFLRCCYTIIESNNEDLFKMEKNRLSLKDLLVETFINVLANSSPANTKAILDKLFTYATTQIFENEQCCNVLKKLIEAALSINAQYAMDKFFSIVARNMLATIGNKSKFEDICKSELLYNLKLLTSCFVCDGSVLVQHQAQIVELIEAIVRIDFDEDFVVITRLLSTLLSSLTKVKLLNKVFVPPKDDPEGEVKRVTNWPQTCQLKNMSLNWYVPSQSEIDFARKLFATFIEPEMASLENWANNSAVDLTKAQLEKSLHIILSFCGVIYCLPNFAGEDQEVPSYLEEDIFATNMFEGSSIRDDLVVLSQKVLNRLVTTADNASLLTVILRLLDYVVFPYDTSSHVSTFDFRKIYQPLNNDNTWIPSVHYSRMDLYQSRLTQTLKSFRNTRFTPAHKNVVDQLLYLATCPFSSVRTLAQYLFMKFFRVFPMATELIVPQMMANLQNFDNFQAFKGSLYLLIGSLGNSGIFQPNHRSQFKLWPQLVKSNFDLIDKPKIAAMMDYKFFSLISHVFLTIPIKRDVLSKRFVDLFHDAELSNFAVPSGEELHAIEVSVKQWSQENQDAYQDLVHQMYLSMHENKLQWRFHTLGTYMMNLLIRHDQPPTIELIQHFLDNLVHDSIHVRRTAVLGLKKILFLNRPAKEVVQVQFDQKNSSQVEDILASEEVYRSTVLHDKVHAGYHDGMYTTKKPISGPVANQFIAQRFSDVAYLDRLFELYSVENTQVIEKDFVKIWKYLFQSFKLFNGELVFPRVEELLTKDKHSHDKLAVEIMNGLVKAAPWLDYADAVKAKTFFSGIVSKNLSSFNSESLALWKAFVCTFFANRDIRRGHWVLEHLFGRTLFLESTSPYYQAAYLKFLSVNLQSNFKNPQVTQSIISKLKDHLSHPYQNVRIAISDVLGELFPVKIGAQTPVTSLSSNRATFVQHLVNRLEQPMSALSVNLDSDSASNMPAIKSAIFDGDSTEGKQLLNLIETICHWITGSLGSKTLVNAADFLPLFPYLCLVQLNNALVQTNVGSAIKKMGKQNYSDAEIELILQLVEKVSKNWNWHSRKQLVLFIQHFLYTNIFALSRNDRWMDAVLNILTTLLEDEVIEVRESACMTLSSLLIWNAVAGKRMNSLVEQFKVKSMKKVRKIKTKDGQREVNADDLRVKHGGVLGLCAFLYAYPVDLPAHLPDILLFLTEHLSAPQPIPKSITTALSSFKRFHLPNWIEYKRKFTSDQLTELNNVLISPSYYA